MQPNADVTVRAVFREPSLGFFKLLLMVSTMSVMLYGIQQRKKTTTRDKITMLDRCLWRPLEPRCSRSRIQEQQMISVTVGSRKPRMW